MRRLPADLAVVKLGLVGYQEAWDLQRNLAEQRAEGQIGDTLLLLEHDPVYTTGRGGRAQNLGGLSAGRAADGTPLVRIGRGGD
ncbi:MAG: lipoyl protein ligase domain-containing protein, partial [Chloroflexota bacterium]